MRALTIAVAVLALLYGGYWFAGRGGAAIAADRAAEMLEARGWDVSWDRVETRGFPSRFDTDLIEPAFVSPSGDAWRGPFVEVLALAYRPTQVIVVLPPEQDLTWRGETYAIATEDMRASAQVAAAPSLPLQETTVEIAGTDIIGPDGTTHFDAALAALRATAEDPTSYDAFLRVTGLSPAGPLGRTPLGPVIARAEADALVTLAAPLDRGALSDGAPPVERVALRHLTLVWGDATVTAEGEVEAGAGGRAEGSLGVEIEAWAPLVDGLEAAGVIDGGTADAVRAAAGVLTFGGADLSLDLTFREGRTFLGPVPIGQAPRLAPPPGG
ncbi:DUF2125 domain-containing protein [Wenxinia marina]|uniref:DUF2125 domain-containing protein n=1 Tax=Wenxinia marina DSM 24838 TaxID=1123501 RepID=A0A0D0NI94_9RHOB|nr:DUF2125 domain-containing protein [Wenxinia marina]KIQ68045.1 hypothetical protein Wenmar_03501 [Wenxinia marina DSM 24838]GGL75147.1 hypothetical protein GCM10011392_32240 [Wenxinia marina]